MTTQGIYANTHTIESKVALTMDELISRFKLSNVADGKSEKTIEWYDDILRLSLRYLETKYPRPDLSHFNADNARAYILYLRARKKFEGRPHTLVQRWFIENYLGCRAMIEQMVEGKAVDVGVEIEGRRIAVEIMIKGEEKELINIVKDLEVGFDEVVIVCEDKEKDRSLERKIGETFGGKYSRVVSFRQLKEFYLEGAKDIGQ